MRIRTSLAAPMGVLTVVASAVGLVVVATGADGANAATTYWAPTRTVIATATATRTVTATATATVTVPGPTQTVTATQTVAGPTTTATVTQTVSASTATPSATAASTTTTAPTPKTLFGAFPGPQTLTDGSSWASREALVTSQLGGKLGVERRYMGGNLTLPAMSTPMIDSWDFPVASTLAGQNDAAIDAIARGATKPLWLVPWHEVDNNKLSPADYIKVFRYVANRVHAVHNPLVKMTTILMGYHVRNGNPTTFDSFYPGDAYVDAIGFDAYINPGVPGMDTPEKAYAEPIALAAQHHKPLVIGETSLFSGFTDAQWTDITGRIIKVLDTPATDAVAWFEADKADGNWLMYPAHTGTIAKWKAVAGR